METIYEILSKLRPEFDYRISENFVSDGLLDSFDIISLVTALEENYGILIDALDIIPENFCSASAIAEVIQRNGGVL